MRTSNNAWIIGLVSSDGGGTSTSSGQLSHGLYDALDGCTNCSAGMACTRDNPPVLLLPARRPAPSLRGFPRSTRSVAPSVPSATRSSRLGIPHWLDGQSWSCRHALNHCRALALTTSSSGWAHMPTFCTFSWRRMLSTTLVAVRCATARTKHGGADLTAMLSNTPAPRSLTLHRCLGLSKIPQAASHS